MTPFAKYVWLLETRQAYAPSNRPIPERVREEARRMRAEGLGCVRIARHFGVTKQAVLLWFKGEKCAESEQPEKSSTSCASGKAQA